MFFLKLRGAPPGVATVALSKLPLLPNKAPQVASWALHRKSCSKPCSNSQMKWPRWEQLAMAKVFGSVLVECLFGSRIAL